MNGREHHTDAERANAAEPGARPARGVLGAGVQLELDAARQRERGAARVRVPELRGGAGGLVALDAVGAPGRARPRQPRRVLAEVELRAVWDAGADLGLRRVVASSSEKKSHRIS
jgi:hypothetical protein